MTLQTIGLLVAIALSVACVAAIVIWRKPRSCAVEPSSNIREEQLAEDIPNALQELLESGSDGAFVVVSCADGERFVQLAWYSNETTERGLLFDFPDVEWSRSFYSSVEAVAKQGSAPYWTERGSDGTRFLDIDFRDDYIAAADFARLVLETVLEQPRDARYSIECHIPSRAAA